MIVGWYDRILHLDFMGPPIELNFNGHKVIRTKFGFCMTICYFAAMVVFSYIIFLSYLSTSEPSIA